MLIDWIPVTYLRPLIESGSEAGLPSKMPRSSLRPSIVPRWTFSTSRIGGSESSMASFDSSTRWASFLGSASRVPNAGSPSGMTSVSATQVGSTSAARRGHTTGERVRGRRVQHHRRQVEDSGDLGGGELALLHELEIAGRDRELHPLDLAGHDRDPARALGSLVAARP